MVAELTACGRLGHPSGALAVSLARRIDSGEESGSAVAAISRELRAAMVEATADVTNASDVLDELRARRAARRGA